MARFHKLKLVETSWKISNLLVIWRLLWSYGIWIKPSLFRLFDGHSKH